MIFYSGLGPVALILGVVGLLLFPVLLVDWTPGLVQMLYEYGIITQVFCLFITGIITFFVGKFINSNIFSWKETDFETGEVYRTRLHSTLFWIPVQYWGIIYIILAILGHFNIVPMV